MSSFLLVFCPQQQATEVEAIKDQLGFGAHTVQQESNRGNGLTRLAQQHFDFVIVGSSLARDRMSAVEEDGGLQFCQLARAVGASPMLLLAPAVTSLLMRDCARISNLTPYADVSSAGSFAIELLDATRGGAARVEASLDIRVRASEAAWSFEMRGVGFDFRGNGDLDVSRAASIFWEARRLDSPDWYDEFEAIGNSIRLALCTENKDFELQLNMGKLLAAAQLGIPAQSVLERVTFEVSEPFYPLLLEAMYDPSMRPEPWLAQASSMSRRLLAAQGGRGDLFAGPLVARRALLICADTHGMAYSDKLNGGQLALKPLNCVKRECRRIRKLLTRADPRTGQPLFHDSNDNVRMIGVDEPVTRASIEAALRDGTWDLIHFAGHTYFQRHGARQTGGTGFLFVDSPDGPDCVDFGDIVSYMRQARFIYLSSCESGNSGFASLASAAGINAVLGYRCQVNDRTAALQAMLFYRTLLRHKALGTAFGEMRRSVYRRYKGTDNAWASAMLLTPECL